MFIKTTKVDTFQAPVFSSVIGGEIPMTFERLDVDLEKLRNEEEALKLLN